MNIEQIYTGCLAQGAYFIESNGEAAVIDPLRETAPYIDRAQRKDVTIKYIFETHFHADFVSGHLDLASKTGATIVYGPNAETSFNKHQSIDGEEFKVGAITIRVLHTPGHTPESTCYLLLDQSGKEKAIFTGDTLFIGDVGRPDLAQKAGHLTKEDLAEWLYDSLRNKIMTLPDHTVVYPGHGAGSACGKNMSKETVGSIGDQKATNYALRANMTRADFIEELTNGLMPPPAYFPLNVKLNKEGYADIKEVLARGDSALDADAFERAANSTGAVMLDVRGQQDFAAGHIPRSIFIGIDGGFAPWVGTLIKDIEQAILLIVEPERLEETITRLSRVGFDNVLGYLEGGFDTWRSSGKEIDVVVSITAEEYAERYQTERKTSFDVRKESEYEAEHVDGALNTPLSSINEHLNVFPDDDFFLHCAGGYRSMIASSILKSRGVHNMIDVQGGFSAIKTTDVHVTSFVCPTATGGS